MKISIIIPCYNEISTIENIIREVQSTDSTFDIIIVDDFSTDGTRVLLQEIQSELKFSLLLHEFNQGKGAALRTGFKAATGDIIVIQDADLEYSPEEIPRLTKL